MELRQLEYFVAVAEVGSFTQAAHRLHIVQSGLSAAIRVLERELRTALFVRSTRRVELTQAGRALLPEAYRALAAARAGQDAVDAVQGLLRGALTVGLHPYRRTGLDVPHLLGRFHREHPGVEVRVLQDTSIVLLDGLRQGAIDIAFVLLPDPVPEDLAVTSLAREPIVLVCAPGHPLADREAVSLSELSDQQFVVATEGAQIGEYPLFALAFSRLGVKPKINCEVRDKGLALDFVVAGLGIALLPREDAARDSRLHSISIEPPMDLDVAVATLRAPVSAAARALLALVSDQAPI